MGAKERWHGKTQLQFDMSLRDPSSSNFYIPTRPDIWRRHLKKPRTLASPPGLVNLSSLWSHPAREEEASPVGFNSYLDAPVASLPGHEAYIGSKAPEERAPTMQEHAKGHGRTKLSYPIHARCEPYP